MSSKVQSNYICIHVHNFPHMNAQSTNPTIVEIGSTNASAHTSILHDLEVHSSLFDPLPPSDALHTSITLPIFR